MIYDFLEIEERLQRQWERERVNAAPNPGDLGFDTRRPRFYILDMFPYPSGVGLHVGHPLGYIGTDILARYKRMRGYNVLHPMGYDAFGLPAENFAVEHGVHPSVTTSQNIENMTRQLKRLGFSYDWDRMLSTTDPEFYRWTQWIFLQLYDAWLDPAQRRVRPIAALVERLERDLVRISSGGELVTRDDPRCAQTLAWAAMNRAERDAALGSQRLAYLDEIPVNWCPMLGTVLANEEVTKDGRSDRGNHPVYRRPLRQWMLRITALADRLIEELDLVQWPESIKAMQRNWVGRSEGAFTTFPLADAPGGIDVFTTRPDTLFGATYVVLAPEHELVDRITTPVQRAPVAAYREAAARKSDLERTELAKTKTGVFTGGYAINPANSERIPVWVADYVLGSYGTGAIMAVPAHDERDFEFAKAFDLEIRTVVTPADMDPAELSSAYVQFDDQTRVVSSANAEISLNGMTAPAGKEAMIAWLEQKGIGSRKVNYKLRDWLFSRQRYWGEPFPILHGPDGEIVAVDASELPVLLPEMEDFTPTASDDPSAPPVPPLARAPDSWKLVEKNGVTYRRELNTMPQWAGSCWYYLRFLDPRNSQAMVASEVEKYWMSATSENPAGGVDLYVGGAEHAVLHLLYARFWHKVLYDLGHVSTPEPFGRLFNQGYILAPSYQEERGTYVSAALVEERDGKYFYSGGEVTRKLGKMGKSLKNAVSPDEIIQQYGCDTLRLYEMALGPLDQSKPWRTQDIIGVHRFLHRLWRLLLEEHGAGVRITDEPPPDDLRRLTHRTIKRVTEGLETLTFNVSVSALIELNNDLVKRYLDVAGGGGRVPRETAETMVLLLSPMAPHITEELWRRLGHSAPVARAAWPTYDPAMLAEAEIEYAVQVNGRLRHTVRVPADADDHDVEREARADARVNSLLAGKTVVRVVLAKGRLINFVVRDGNAVTKAAPSV